MATPGTWQEFKGDLRQSLKAWRIAPLLPAASAVLFLATYFQGPWAWLTFPVLLFAVGWVGTERLWYLRIYRGEAMGARELWRVTWAYFWRFLRLGFVAGLLWSPVLILVLRRIADDPENAQEAMATPSVWIASAVFTILIDFLLTFVTPALTFTTKRVRTAFRVGIRMLRDNWPQTAWYALVPPLAVVLMLRIAEPTSLSLASRLLMSVGSTLLNLWFKGATAAFYLRRVEVESQGAAFVERNQEPLPA